MADSFQNEIPKARINIALNVETGGAQKKKELPLKMLVLGDFAPQNARSKLEDRELIDITKNNFSQVLSDIAPELKFNVINRIKNDGSEFSVKLKLDDMKKFHPEGIVDSVPELRKMLAMRNLLKDLRANLIDNNAFRKELEKVLKTDKERKALANQLNSTSENSNQEGSE